jgi:uncharacterized protein GlcG (DUF336 family)
MKTSIFALALATVLPAVAGPAILNEPALSTDAAIEVATAALAQCRKEGQKVAVAVVDASGRVKVAIRDDGAAPHTAEHSMRKAYTALSYKTTSAEVGKRAGEAKGAQIGPQLLPNITTSAGGVPIKMGTLTLGAVGVSGTPGSAGGGEHDAKCAEAGIEKIAKELAAK